MKVKLSLILISLFLATGMISCGSNDNEESTTAVEASESTGKKQCSKFHVWSKRNSKCILRMPVK